MNSWIVLSSAVPGLKVSQWLVYADGVRDYIVQARAAQDTEPAHAERIGRVASDASLRTDLELARQDNRRLRDEVARLKAGLQEWLGQQVEVTASETLRSRIDELSDSNRRYQVENASLTEKLEDMTKHLRLTEDELAACRANLRHMIKAQTLDIQTNGSVSRI